MIAEDFAKLKEIDHVTWFNLNEQGIFSSLDSDIASERNRALDIIQGTIQRAMLVSGADFRIRAVGNSFTVWIGPNGSKFAFYYCNAPYESLSELFLRAYCDILENHIDKNVNVTKKRNARGKA